MLCGIRRVLGTHPSGVVRDGAVLGIILGELAAGVMQEGLQSEGNGKYTVPSSRSEVSPTVSTPEGVDESRSGDLNIHQESTGCQPATK